jgi:hypothetical protein
LAAAALEGPSGGYIEAFASLEGRVNGTNSRIDRGDMQVRKVIRRRTRRQVGGVNVAADIDAVVSVNTGEEGQINRSRVRSRRRIVQRSGQDRGSSPPDPDAPMEGGE